MTAPLRLAALSAAASLAAGTASADLTAAQVWTDWQASATNFGQTALRRKRGIRGRNAHPPRRVDHDGRPRRRRERHHRRSGDDRAGRRQRRHRHVAGVPARLHDDLRRRRDRQLLAADRPEPARPHGLRLARRRLLRLHRPRGVGDAGRRGEQRPARGPRSLHRAHRARWRLQGDAGRHPHGGQHAQGRLRPGRLQGQRSRKRGRYLRRRHVDVRHRLGKHRHDVAARRDGQPQRDGRRRAS